MHIIHRIRRIVRASEFHKAETSMCRFFVACTRILSTLTYSRGRRGGGTFCWIVRDLDVHDIAKGREGVIERGLVHILG